MPLCDHFHPPLADFHDGRSFLAAWPAMTVMDLFEILPPGYRLAPRVETVGFRGDNLGPVDSYDRTVGPDPDHPGWVPDAPSSTFRVGDAGPIGPIAEEFSVHVIDQPMGGVPVAAIEFVCPSHTDWPEARRAFLTRCLAMLQAGVSVTIVDLVTLRQTNFQRHLMREFGEKQYGPAPHLYAGASRFATRDRLETWEYPMALGKALPTVPLWLDVDLAVPLDLERIYRRTCKALRITDRFL